MLLLLLLHPLFQHPLNFFLAETHIFQGLLLVPVGVVLEHVGPVEPVHQLLGHLLLEGHVLKIFQKTAVEAVKVGLALHQQAAAQVIKPSEAGAVEPFVHGLHEGHPLRERDLQAVSPQQVEKILKHCVSFPFHSREKPLVSRAGAWENKPWKFFWFFFFQEKESPPDAAQGVHVLVLLQQHPQIGHLLADAAHVHAAVLEGLNPVDDLAGGGLLLDLGQLADLIEGLQHLGEQLLVQVGIVDPDDVRHQLLVGEGDVVEHAAAQEASGSSFSALEVMMTTGGAWP